MFYPLFVVCLSPKTITQKVVDDMFYYFGVWDV